MDHICGFYASKNIENAEKVFCYTVDYAQADYSGYTINDLAITGSCGELSADGKNLIKDMLLNNNLVFSTATDSCNINPRILLRYINGIDSTDILLSAPCHSLTFFHGRDISTLNAAPGKDIVEQIVSTYSSLSEKFLSPALLGQMVPNGQVLTQDQKEIVRKINTIESPKKWSKKQTTNTTAQTDTITFAGTFDNKEYNVYLTIDFYHNNVVVPNQEIFGEMAGYFGDKRDNRKWLFTSAEITDSTTATINITNDYGSEDLVATLSKQENGTFMLIQEKGSTLKIARNSKWVKLPKKLLFTKRGSGSH